MTCEPCRAKQQELLRKYIAGDYIGAAKAVIEGVLMVAGLIEKPYAQTEQQTTILPDAKHDL